MLQRYIQDPFGLRTTSPLPSEVPRFFRRLIRFQAAQAQLGLLLARLVEVPQTDLGRGRVLPSVQKEGPPRSRACTVVLLRYHLGGNTLSRVDRWNIRVVLGILACDSRGILRLLVNLDFLGIDLKRYSNFSQPSGVESCL